VIEAPALAQAMPRASSVLGYLLRSRRSKARTRMNMSSTPIASSRKAITCESGVKDTPHAVIKSERDDHCNCNCSCLAVQ